MRRLFLDNKKGIGEIHVMESQIAGTCFGASSTHGLLKTNKKPNAQFLVVSQSFSN
jgi:hypothetical protein